MQDTSSQWHYPGARWWKFDFHTHTPASDDYGKGPTQAFLKRTAPKDWLLGFMRAGVDCVAVTDHNSGEWIEKLQAALVELEQELRADFRPLYLFPGVELSVNGGFHLLVIFDRKATGHDVRDLLSRVDYQGVHGRCDAVTRKSAAEVIEIVSWVTGRSGPIWPMATGRNEADVRGSYGLTMLRRAQFCRSGGTGSAVWKRGKRGVPAAHPHPAVGAALLAGVVFGAAAQPGRGAGRAVAAGPASRWRRAGRGCRGRGFRGYRSGVVGRVGPGGNGCVVPAPAVRRAAAGRGLRARPVRGRRASW